jgi:hypothetical protein
MDSWFIGHGPSICIALVFAMPIIMIGISEMTGADAHLIRFQCPKCKHDLDQTIGSLKLSDHMRCNGCGVGINIDTNRLANAAEEMQSAMEKVPPEITIKFFH